MHFILCSSARLLMSLQHCIPNQCSPAEGGGGPLCEATELNCSGGPSLPPSQVSLPTSQASAQLCPPSTVCVPPTATNCQQVLPVLGALPDSLIILTSLNASRAEAQEAVAVGIGECHWYCWSSEAGGHREEAAQHCLGGCHHK